MSFSARAVLSAPRSPQSPRPICTSASSSSTMKVQKNPHNPRAGPHSGPARAAIAFQLQGNLVAD